MEQYRDLTIEDFKGQPVVIVGELWVEEEKSYLNSNSKFFYCARRILVQHIHKYSFIRMGSIGWPIIKEKTKKSINLRFENFEKFYNEY